MSKNGLVDFNITDGLTPLQIQKLNTNFKIIANTLSELTSQSGNNKVIVNTLQATVSNIRTGLIEADRLIVEDLTANYAHINYLDTDYAVIDNAYIDYARINNVLIDTADIKDAAITTAKIKDAAVESAKIKDAAIITAKIADAAITTAKINDASITNAKIGLAAIATANIQNAAITNALIANEAVASSQIISVSANKLTTGTIDAAKINVINLKAENLEVKKINGQPVFGGFTIVNQSQSGYSSKNPSTEGWYELFNNAYVLTEDTEVVDGKFYYAYVAASEIKLYDQQYIDNLADDINERIDGTIQTYTGDVVPLAISTSYPYSDWYDPEANPPVDNRAEHVGDIYYVINVGSDYDGYTYRFAYDTTSQQYAWVLIKDNQVTAALGRITDLETFESTTSSWIEETDEGLETIRTNHTTLSGVVDKTIVETIQLWYSKANTTAPNKPTSQVTSTSTSGNAWRTVVPEYNSSYPNYFYCYQWKYADGTYGWSSVTRDIAMGESQAQARLGVATANANIKSSVQLWFTKANSTAPSAPSAHVTTNNASTANAWNIAVPTYNSSYPHYFYCYEYQKGDNTYAWSDVVYDKATTETQALSNAALPASTFTTFQQTTFKDVVDTVSEQSSTITQLTESVEYGGHNMLNNSALVVLNEAPYNNSNATEYTTSYGGVLALYCSGSKWVRIDFPELITGEKYTLSFDATRSNAQTVYITIGSTTTSLGSTSSTSGEWKRFKHTFTADSNTYARIRVYSSSDSGSATYVASFKNFKLEYGTIATPWDYSQPDKTTLTNTVNSVSQTATSNSSVISSLTQTLGTNADGTTASNDIVHQVSGLSQDLSGFQTTVSETYATINNVSSNYTTKTEFNNLEIGGRNLLKYTASPKISEWERWSTYNTTERTSDGIKLTTPNASVGGFKIPLVYDGAVDDATTLTLSFDYRTTFTTFGSIYLLCNPAPNVTQSGSLPAPVVSETEWQHYEVTFSYNAHGERVGRQILFPYVAQTGRWLEIKDSSMKLERGNKATDWTPAPEDISTRMDSAESSITQTANSITSLVANNSTYTAPDGTVQTNTIKSAIAQNASDIELRVEKSGVISAINLSSESATISADKVNIEGATIFTSGRLSSDSLNAAYDAAGSAAAVQTNLNNLEVGGRNLLLKTGEPASYSTTYLSIYEASSVVRTMSSTDVATVSFEAKSSQAQYIRIYFRSAETGGSAYNNLSNFFKTFQIASADTWTRYTYTAAIGSNVSSFAWIACMSASAASGTSSSVQGTVEIRNMKLEKGNVATDWTPAPEDMASASDSVEYIIGTQTESTGSWTGNTRDSALYDGKTIAYKLPFAGSGDASLNLTFSNDTTTGAKGVFHYYSTSSNTSAIARVNTHYPAGSVIVMSYDMANTRWLVSNYNTNVDTVNRTRWQNVIKAAAAITSGRVICGTASGYRNIAAGVSFDLSYPLLYCGTTKAAGGTSDNNFLQINGIKVTNNGTVTSAAYYKTVYLVGTISGNTFTILNDTINSTPFMTTVAPDSENGLFYIPLGMFYNSTTNIYFNSTKDLYAFLDEEFRQVTPTEIVAEQQVYIQASSVTDVLTLPNEWIEESGESTIITTLNDTTTITTVWTIKYPTYSSDRPVTFVATQRKRLDGTVICSNPLPDDTTTVIDGGNIISHTIQAHHLMGNTLTLANMSTEVTEKFNEWDEAVDDVSSLSNQADGFSRRIGNIEGLESQVQSHDGQLNTIMNSLRFAEGELELKTQGSGSSTSVALTSTKLGFRYDNSEVAYLSDEKLYVTKAQVLDTMQMGGFAWIPRSNGNLSLKWIGA